MKVGLLNIGSDTWIAGVYYISNLIRALRILPECEQPDIFLIFTSEVERKYYEDIEDLVCILPHYRPGRPVSLGSKIRLTFKQLLDKHIFKLSQDYRPNQCLRDNKDTDLERSLGKKGISLIFPCMKSLGPNFGTPWLAWVWDFQHKYYPELFSNEECQERDLVFSRIAVDSRLIVASSHTVLADFDRFVPGYAQKLRVLHFHTVPLASWYAADAIQTCRQFNLPTRYLMLPNQFWVHKNHQVAFQALRILLDRGKDAHLVCTGHTNDYRQPEYFQNLCDYMKIHNLESRIRILGLIPRHEQIQIMRGAMAIVQPSLFEGWSTVVEDSRALGKRIFLSLLPVHLEQNPPGSVYFNPRSPEMLAEEIGKVWDALVPGPCLVEEQSALAEQKKLVSEYARTFLYIAQELLYAWNHN